MNGCRKCPAFAKCTVYEYRGSECASLRSTYGIESDTEIITNGDRIRDMSDEELAETIVDADWCEICCQHWAGKRRPEVDLYPAQMKIRFEREDKHGTETD